MKNIKDFLTRHVFITIFLYFSFMLTTAWAISEHIGARTALAVLPADDDVLAIYDTSTTSGKGIAVSVFRGANLNAIVDACEGVAAPAMGLYDSNNAGADTTCTTGDKLAGTLEANCTDTTEDSEDCDLVLKSMLAGTNTQRVMFDTSDGQWEFDYPITAPGIDGGQRIVVNPGAVDLDTTYPNVCNIMFTVGDQATEIELWDDVMCDADDLYGKQICVTARGAYAITLDPNDSDVLSVGAFASLAAGEALVSSGALGDAICLVGRVSGENQLWTNKGYADATSWPDPSP